MTVYVLASMCAWLGFIMWRLAVIEKLLRPEPARRCMCGGNDMDGQTIAVHRWGFHTREKCEPWSEGHRRALESAP